MSMTATFSKDGTKADLTTGGNLMAGTYAITATAGVTGTGTVVVKDRYVASIKLTSAKMVLVATATSGDANYMKNATVSYKAFDQYGTDITSNVLANSINWNCSIGSADDNNNGTVKITKTSIFNVGDTAVLTGVSTNTTSGTTSATATVTYAAYTTIASMTFGTPILPTGASAIVADNYPAATLPVTVTDDEGNTITDPATLASDLIISTSDSQVNTNITNDAGTYSDLPLM
jgi:hypothetical protein